LAELRVRLAVFRVEDVLPPVLFEAVRARPLAFFEPVLPERPVLEADWAVDFRPVPPPVDFFEFARRRASAPTPAAPAAPAATRSGPFPAPFATRAAPLTTLFALLCFFLNIPCLLYGRIHIYDARECRV
jgi:hypothetical protein